MNNNIYPIQIEKSMFVNIITTVQFLVVVFLITFIFSFISAVFTIIIAGVIMILGIFWSWLYLNSIKYSLESKHLTFQGGVISRFEKTLPYSKIQHVITYESFWKRIFGLADVSIETAREGLSISREGKNISLYTGPIIPGLLKKDAEKLKEQIISLSQKRYKFVAGI